MESEPNNEQQVKSDLQNRLVLIAYVPILCLGVLAAGGLVFLPSSTGVRVFGIFALLGIAVSIVVTYRTISSILESVDEVAVSADSLVAAQMALLDNDPEPLENWQKLDESPDDEFGRVGASLNALHANTLEVGRNQNDSIKEGISNIVINLARRSQTLLDRQVEYIDALESSEEDPDRLEQMFKVDHLATRMRRNAESLLVLAEADPGRRRGGPVAMADVLRVAMGEIENYQHIHLSNVDPGRVSSATAVDLAHMTAELMENATQFSPPDAPVEVSGYLDGDHYLISIVDDGMGMTEEQLATANATMLNPPELGLAMGRSLGFVVIGRLAQRLGASVSLEAKPEAGITATIFVPTSAFSSVGDSTGVRRSVVAPAVEDTPQHSDPIPSAEDDESSALSKLLGIRAESGGATGLPNQDVPVADLQADPFATTGLAAPVAQSGWVPPAATAPDAPMPDLQTDPFASSAPTAASEQHQWPPASVAPQPDAGQAVAGGHAPVVPEQSMPDLETDPFGSSGLAAPVEQSGPPAVAPAVAAEVTKPVAQHEWPPKPVAPEPVHGHPAAHQPAPVAPEVAPQPGAGQAVAGGHAPVVPEQSMPDLETDPFGSSGLAAPVEQSGPPAVAPAVAAEVTKPVAQHEWPPKPVAPPPVHGHPTGHQPAPVEQSGWTPPPVTPEVARPVEQSGWTPPPVTPEVARPVEQSGWTPPPVTPEVMRPVEQSGWTPPPVTPEVMRPVEQSGWTPPPVTPDVGTPSPVEPAVAAIDEPVSRLDQALPTGVAFESGVASLFETAQGPSPVAAPEHAPGATPGLTRRRRGESTAPVSEGRPVVTASNRNPEEKRSMLSRYRDGIKGNPSPDRRPH